MTEASWLSCGSWGSSASKLEVDVDRVGPRLGDASGASASSLLLFSPLLDILSEIFVSQPSSAPSITGTAVRVGCVVYCVWSTGIVFGAE